MKKKVSDIIVDFLDKKGISQVFGVTGGGATVSYTHLTLPTQRIV